VERSEIVTQARQFALCVAGLLLITYAAFRLGFQPALFRCSI
jgi:hypothetical protein